MTLPDARQLIRTTDATWPAAVRRTLGPWTIRTGLGGGQRVSATTLNRPLPEADLRAALPEAEAAMAAAHQPALFMVRPQDGMLDHVLERAGYRVKDPVSLYACPIQTLSAPQPARLSAFAIWPPLAIMAELWDEGGIGPARRAVMARAEGPKCAILARQNDRAAGTAFVAIHENIAMLHALEVTPSQRRQSVANNIMRVAALWAQDHGATSFSVVVTQANTAANRLYASLNMKNMGHYHYRIKRPGNGPKE